MTKYKNTYRMIYDFGILFTHPIWALNLSPLQKRKISAKPKKLSMDKFL